MSPTPVPPFVLVTTHRVDPDRRDEFTQLAGQFEGLLRQEEPDLLAYHVYADDETSEVTLLQVHRDTESAERHMRIAGEYIGRGLALAPTVRAEAYGRPGPLVAEALAHNAQAGAVVSVKPARLGGFVRA